MDGVAARCHGRRLGRICHGWQGIAGAMDGTGAMGTPAHALATDGQAPRRPRMAGSGRHKDTASWADENTENRSKWSFLRRHTINETLKDKLPKQS